MAELLEPHKNPTRWNASCSGDLAVRMSSDRDGFTQCRGPERGSGNVT